ncbi:MAG: carboxypeptidase regulatory-like domain-containing protein, partial [Myxococcota bacterium]
GPQGPAGPAGDDCSAVDNGDGTYTITCGDTEVTLEDGEDGADGEPGADGDDCSAVDNGDGTYTITCGDTEVTLSDGQDGVIAGTVGGTLTNALTGAPLEGVTVAFSPDVDGEVITDASGTFSVELPVGAYDVTIEAEGYEPFTAQVNLVAGGDVSLDAALEPTAAVAVEVTADVSEPEPSDTVALSAEVTPWNDTTVDSYSWAFADDPGTEVGTGETFDVTLDGLEAYKDRLWDNVRLEGRDRLGPLGINHFALHHTMATEVVLTVTMDDGSEFHTEYEIDAVLPFDVSTGLNNVPLNVPVVLHAPEAASYAWSVLDPNDDPVSLDDETSRHPVFYPNVVGEYLVEVNGESFSLYAGEWEGVIDGLDENGRPTSSSCSGCHSQFDDWKETGHAEIFTDNINTGGHYSTSCLECHTVGFDELADNGGFDDAADYDDFLAADYFHITSLDNYPTMLDEQPDTASLGNIQCENCHGPQNNGGLHMDGDTARVSLDSDVCASCHGEPKRHARYQQWLETGHANYGLATSRSGGSCGKCHSGQGFVAWAKNDFEGYDAPEGLSGDTAHPVTCATCHDPHKQGTTSGEPNTATVRVSGDSPMLDAGFQATGVGHGAVCMSCHNSRRGLRNDFAAVDPGDYGRAPHGPAQADNLMGQNAFFVNPGDRSPHSFIENSCTNCHMVQMDPPAELSYNLGGTNHTFKADTSVCGKCHTEFDGGTMQASFEAGLMDLEHKIGAAVAERLNGMSTFYVSGFDPATGFDTDGVVAVDLTSASVVDAHAASHHGSQALLVTFDTDVTVDLIDDDEQVVPTAVGSIEAVLTGYYADAAGTTAVFPQSGDMWKAVWNLLVLTNDGSHGVHNPGFSMDVLNATLVQELNPPLN